MTGLVTGPGVYVVIGEFDEAGKRVLYIGSSGKFRIVEGEGQVSIRNKGVFARITKGKKQKKHRFTQWHDEMIKLGADKLHIYSFQTAFPEKEDYEHNKIPLYAEAFLMQSYYEKYKLPPEWNLSF